MAEKKTLRVRPPIEHPDDREHRRQIAAAVQGLLSREISISSQGVLAPHKNLVVKNGTTAASQVTVTADELVVTDVNGDAQRLLESVNEADIDITASGAGGLDTGAEASSTWYHIWIIAKSEGAVAGLLSTSATDPTMPSGYAFNGYVGAVFNDSGSAFLTFGQVDRAASVEQVQDLTDGGATSFTSVSVTVPTTAKEWIGYLSVVNSTGGIADASAEIGSTSDQIGRIILRHENTPNGGEVTGAAGSIALIESQTVYYKANDASFDVDVRTVGWRF